MKKPETESLYVVDILDALSYLHVSGIYPNARDEWEESLESWQREEMSSDSYHRVYLNDEPLTPVMRALVDEFGITADGKYGHFLIHHTY